MAKRTFGFAQLDHDALMRAVGLYKKLSSRCAAELSAMILRDGWRAGALYAARRLQQISFGLGQFEAAPCELRERKIGSLKDVWMADPRGVDMRRPEMVMILKQLRYYGLSRYEPRPLPAIEGAKLRREPSGDVA
jgi:hypothetical protein